MSINMTKKSNGPFLSFHYKTQFNNKFIELERADDEEVFTLEKGIG